MNVPNFLSFLRLFLTLPVAWALLEGNNTVAFIISLVVAGTDISDGIIARKLNQITELGKIIDPIADKTFYGVLSLILLITGQIPVWFFCTIIGRDLLILVGGIFAMRKSKIVIQSNALGKATVVVLFWTLMFSILNLSDLAQVFYFISTALLATSLILYSIGLKKMM